MDTRRGILIIACGALAREIHALREANGWDIDIKCLAPELHNRPQRIAPAVRAEIRASRDGYRTIFVAYAECGTMGQLDQVLAEEGVERLPGAHCHEAKAQLSQRFQEAVEHPDPIPCSTPTHERTRCAAEQGPILSRKYS